MAGENERQDVDISTGKGIGGGVPEETTQTQKTETTTDAGNGKTDDGEGGGTGKEEGKTSEEGGEGGAGDGGESDINPQTGKPWTADEWRDKFRASSRGAQDLLTKVNTLESEKGNIEKESGEKITALTKKVEELTAIAEGKNPEGLTAHQLQEQLANTTKQLATVKENQELDAFEKSNPLATTKREALRSLARANPTTPLQQLWDNNLKSGAEAEAVAAKAKSESQKKDASEQGKGTSTREPAGGGDTVKGTKGDTGLTLAEFNAKPVAERRALMEKFGV